MYKRMLVPLDESKLAEEVFPYARELAGRLDLNLDFLNVCGPDEAHLLPMRQIYVDKMAQTVLSQKSIETTGKVIIGYPAEEILK